MRLSFETMPSPSTLRIVSQGTGVPSEPHTCEGDDTTADGDHLANREDSRHGHVHPQLADRPRIGRGGRGARRGIQCHAVQDWGSGGGVSFDIQLTGMYFGDEKLCAERQGFHQTPGEPSHAETAGRRVSEIHRRARRHHRGPPGRDFLSRGGRVAVGHRHGASWADRARWSRVGIAVSLPQSQAFR